MDWLYCYQSEIEKIKNARIEYSSTKIIVNTSKEKTMFALNFELYTLNDFLPDYVYSKIYNYEGKFMYEELKKL